MMSLLPHGDYGDDGVNEAIDNQDIRILAGHVASLLMVTSM